MLKTFKTLLCILAAVSHGVCFCPSNEIRAHSECMFQITCHGRIAQHEVEAVPDKCLGSSNIPVKVEVFLKDALDRFDSNIDDEDDNFLNTITDLKISAKWKETALAILQYTHKLKRLILVDIGLEKLYDSPFNELSELEDLNLSYNNLSEIRDLFRFEDYPNKLKRLFLAHNALEYIPRSTFKELSSLVELDLSYNKISNLNVEPFCNLTKLEVLRLNDNRIKDLNGAVNYLDNLKHLYLKGNQIQNIDDESLKTIEHLETFDVSRNELDQMKPIMFSRHWNHFANYSTCKIILSGNHISMVPNGTYNEIYVNNLANRSMSIHTEIDLSFNSINFIAYNAFQSLIRVELLDLSKNKIDYFDINADDLAYIKYLNLSSNLITHLYYESFSRMNNLQNLDLSNNNLAFIPDMTFSSNYNLKLVNMTYNVFKKLASIQIIMFHPEGGVLDLSNNTLSELKIPYGEGIRLTTLILHSNKILNTSLIDLSLQTDLKILDMSINEIDSLEMSSLRLPVNLEDLHLASNRIKRIGPSAFHTLVNLKFLGLGHNSLTYLEYGAFHGLKALHYLDLSYNRIRHIDSKLLTDLKSLKILSLRSNDMISLDYKGWFGHKFDINVYIDNNNLTCNWLVDAINDYKNEISKMKAVVLVPTRAHHSVEGIPCLPDTLTLNKVAPMGLERRSKYTDDTSNTILEAVREENYNHEKILIINQKILEAIREENNNLRQFIWYSIQKDKEKLSTTTPKNNYSVEKSKKYNLTKS